MVFFFTYSLSECVPFRTYELIEEKLASIEFADIWLNSSE